MRPTSDDSWTAGAAYESYMGRWSRSLANLFVEWLRPEPSSHWLEVGCGTGALTSAICRLGNPESVTACDSAEPFIKYARNNFEDTRASFVVAGVDSLPWRDGGFDAVVSALVLNFLREPEKAIGLMRERLRPGGVIAACVWDYADGMEFLCNFWEEAVSLDPDAAALDERRRFLICRLPALESLFRSAGLEQVETGQLELPTDFDNFDDYWSPFLSGTGPAPAYVASLDPIRRDLLKNRLRDRLRAGSLERIPLRARAWAVRGFAK